MTTTAEPLPITALSSPSQAVSTAPALVPLSPSRAGDFMACPLRYRFRTIDRLPERSSPAAVRGTVVHAVLERLFDLPPAARTAAAAQTLLPKEWQRMQESDPRLAELLGPDADGPTAAAWLAAAAAMVEGYFTLEDPRRLEPAARESLVEVRLDSGLRLRGYIDRLDETPDGDLCVVDYKTGRTPAVMEEARALFQLKFYALVLWRTRGRIPGELRLLYLRDRDMLRYRPDEGELAALERLLVALSAAISRATATGDFRPRLGPVCGWCDHHSLCPARGGVPPPMHVPAEAPEPGPVEAEVVRGAAVVAAVDGGGTVRPPSMEVTGHPSKP